MILNIKCPIFWQVFFWWDLRIAKDKQRPSDTQAPTKTDNSCRWANDESCDDSRFCDAGSDCTDCRNCDIRRGLLLTRTAFRSNTEKQKREAADIKNHNSCESQQVMEILTNGLDAGMLFRIASVTTWADWDPEIWGHYKVTGKGLE